MKIEHKEIPQDSINKTIYISDDGKKFDSESECWLHEKYKIMKQENRVKILEDVWYLFNTQNELDEYCLKKRSDNWKFSGKFPVWLKFDRMYGDQWEDYYMVPLTKNDYENICEQKKMIEETQL